MSKITIEGVFTLFDDESVRKKLTVMTAWEAMMDDARNPDVDFEGGVQGLLQLGKSYRVQLIVEEVETPLPPTKE